MSLNKIKYVNSNEEFQRIVSPLESSQATGNSGKNISDGKVKSIDSAEEFERIVGPLPLAIVLFGTKYGSVSIFENLLYILS